MIVTYFSENELDGLKQVTNPTINELLQELRQKDDRLYLREIVYAEEKNLFRGTAPKEYRYIIYNVNGAEAQIMNFPVPNTDHKFRSGYSSAQTITYLYGLINGISLIEKQNANETK